MLDPVQPWEFENGVLRAVGEARVFVLNQPIISMIYDSSLNFYVYARLFIHHLYFNLPT